MRCLLEIARLQSDQKNAAGALASLGHPAEEHSYVLIPVGYPTPGATVPDIRKKSLDEVRVIV